ncbi:probable G-protein coupled receptor 139 [Liolophura sinensis]|uniref:probable G-protein coupled receptor 139 n=1 Tax=Liolophura sinensis TaxID=3198878 RepID=UPI0031589D98
MELAVTASMLLAAMCQTVTMYCKMLLPSNGGQDEAVHCMGQVCVTCVERAEIATVERRKEIALATAAFFFIMVSFITCVADLLVRRVTKSSHTLFVRITWCVTVTDNMTEMENITLAMENTTMNTTTETTLPQGEVIDGNIIRYLPLYMAAYWLDTTYLWTLTIVGLIGNSLSMVTILRMRPQTSSSLYVAFLAVMDSCSLVIKLVFQQVTKYDIGIGSGGCRVLLFLGNASVMVANWLVVVMTAERLLAIWFPFKVAEISTKSKAYIVYISLLVAFMGVNCFYLFTFEEDYDEVTFFTCEPMDEYKDVVVNVLYWLDAVCYALAPCLLLIIFNCLIVLGTWMSVRVQKKLTQNKDQMDEKRKQQNQITVMLVTVSVIFLVLTMPNGIFFMHTGNWNPNSNDAWAEKILVERIILFLSDCNHAVNFFLYFLSGRRFRKMFLKMFCPKCAARRQQESTYGPGAVSSTRATALNTVSYNADYKM